jgi:hypothetical protein
VRHGDCYRVHCHRALHLGILAMNHTARLLMVADAHDDATVAAWIAEAALEADRLPYAFSIDHNVGAPKYEACPLTYDFKFARTVGINTSNRLLAKTWIIQAVKLGYTVTRAGHRTPGIKDNEPYGFAYSIKRVRERATYHQTPRVENDDDIPF